MQHRIFPAFYNAAWKATLQEACAIFCNPGEFRKKDKGMLYWALVFLLVAIIAGVFGFAGIAAASAGIAKILFVIFLVLFLLSLIRHLSRRV